MTELEIHSLVAPYALDALDDDERERFEAHLDECSSCLEELAGFVATSERLATSASQTPPAALRASVLAAASVTPQDRPVVSSLARHRARRRRMITSIAGAAAAAVIAVSVGGYLVEHERMNDIEAQQQTMSAVLSASDATTSEAKVEGGTVRMTRSDVADGAVVVASGMKAPSGHTYQLWSLAGGKATSVGTVDGTGTLLVRGVDAADAVAFTVEPEGGSKQPTTSPVATMPV